VQWSIVSCYVLWHAVSEVLFCADNCKNVCIRLSVYNMPSTDCQSRVITRMLLHVMFTWRLYTLKLVLTRPYTLHTVYQLLLTLPIIISAPQWDTAKAAFDYLLYHMSRFYKGQTNMNYLRTCGAAFVPTSKQGALFAQPSELYIEPNMDESRREHPFGIRLVWRPYARYSNVFSTSFPTSF
jgi:hypothetical protein